MNGANFWIKITSKLLNTNHLTKKCTHLNISF